MLTWFLVLLLPAALGLLIWIRRRRRRPAAGELPTTPYVCHRCNATDCHCDPLN